MTESRALILSFTVLGLVVTVAFVGLTFLHAKVEILTATIILIGCLGAHVVSRIVLHYPPRHETLLTDRKSRSSR